MTTGIHRRLRQLEVAGGRGHPWHLPFALWSDAQTTALVSPGRRTWTNEDMQRFLIQAPDDVLAFFAQGAVDEQDVVPSA